MGAEYYFGDFESDSFGFCVLTPHSAPIRGQNTSHPSMVIHHLAYTTPPLV